MQVKYVPLLQEMQRLYGQPRTMDRFRDYLRTMLNPQGDDLETPPLVLINPMAREHLLAIVDALVVERADELAAPVAAAAAAEFDDLADELPVSLVVLDDLRGGWTSRASYELMLRRLPDPRQLSAKQARRCWASAVLWSSEPPTIERVAEAVRCAVYRAGYVRRHGGARTLQELLAQEGWVLCRAGSDLPPLDAQAQEWTRTVVAECAACDDPPTLIECLCGDELAATLGYAGQGLAPWAGLRWAQGEARGALTPG